MACPYFLPTHRLEPVGWVRAPRMPLGDAYAGTCHADALEVVEPGEARLRELCNCGYARGRCERFPPDAPADAVRFSASQTGEVIYILEKSHSPIEHGALRTEGILADQARAFRESQRRRMGASA